MKCLLPLTLLFLCVCTSFGQSNVRAWYADGQVFVVWNYDIPIEETYAVYASTTPFTNTSQASLVGRPFFFEYIGYGLKDNLMDTTATYKIPDAGGGKYQLQLNEGLFVFTPHQNGSLYFAVTKWNDDVVMPGVNITDDAVPFSYDPVSDPVECHLQRTFPSPFANGFICFAYSMWLDGRQNYWEGRPDFPVMANASKNGMPSLFLVSAPVDLDTTNPFPLSVWLHGGGGIARQSLAGSRAEVDIRPRDGIIVAHDDKMYGYRGASPPHGDQPTWHFGYSKNYDPFTDNSAVQLDTVINYTQRRYLWIDHWLAKNFNVDTNRINIHGHSMGSAGTLALAKAFPRHYGSATLFNTGCAGPDSISNTKFIFGNRSNNLPTNLTNRKDKTVRFYDLWDLYTNCSPERDLPLMRHWHGKHDDNGVMHWSPVVIENFHIADSIGTGIQNYWSERPHGIDMSPAFNDHWIMGIPENQQTVRDNVSTAEHYRGVETFPAFFNHRKDEKNHDPGTGLIGINNGDGDNWGTWGGYHRWGSPYESEHLWVVSAWLEDNAVYDNDNAEDDFLTAEVAIRKPNYFKPSAGQLLFWRTIDQITDDTLQSGITIVQDNDVVVIPHVNVYKQSIRKIWIEVSDMTTGVSDDYVHKTHTSLSPNPTSGRIRINKNWDTATIFDVKGTNRMQLKRKSQKEDLDVSDLPEGIYFIRFLLEDGTQEHGRFVKY